MRITVDIDDNLLNDLARCTGETKKSPAISKAVREYVNRQMAKEFGRRLREGDFSDAWETDYDPNKFDNSKE